MAMHDQIGGYFKLNPPNSRNLTLEEDTYFSVEGDEFFITDVTDETKKLRFSAANITTATTRVVTVPDRDFTVGGGPGNRVSPILASTNLTLTSALSGSLVVIDGASQAIVLPALAAADIGVFFDFIVQTTSTTVTITAGAGDILHGGVTIMSTNAGLENDAFSANGSSDLVTTMNGTTKGGIIGSRLRFEAWSATAWLVSGNLIGSGSIVTPFS